MKNMSQNREKDYFPYWKTKTRISPNIYNNPNKDKDTNKRAIVYSYSTDTNKHFRKLK